MDYASQPRSRRRIAAAGAAASCALILGWLFWWKAPPQLGGDKEAAKAVDALFTAVTARDERLLGRCDDRLHAHAEAGNLLPDARDYLDGIIAEARLGRWEPAARRLYDFMKAQRPEGMRGRNTKPA
jgi:hypothetical protein